ncbi:MAG: AmmeMemoRadiSam system protein A [Firmicutes bacterium]|nr:AmmeMemoRadiSam system protein A [Bacillota bacterium]
MSILAGFMVPHPPMIVPAVGRGGEEQIRQTTAAYEQVAEEIAKLQPETIIITSPHSIMYADYFHVSPGKTASGSFAQFGAREVSFEETYDEELVSAICDLADRNGFPAGTLGERDKRLDHGTMVPLWFIRQKWQDFRLVRIGLSGLPLTDHYRFGQLLRKAVHDTGRRAVLIASGDLSHKLQDYGPYGFAKEGPAYDERVMDVCGRAAFGELLEFEEDFCEKAAECGHRSFVIMAGAFDGQEVTAQKLVHQDVTGVGYGICTFYPGGADDSRRFLDQYMEKAQQACAQRRAEEDPYVQLARQALEAYVLRREVIRPQDIGPERAAGSERAPGPEQPGDPAELPEELLTTQAGAFVSVHEGGALRGCIGTIGPTRATLAEEIIGNAISAATRDPRFSPIRPEELPMLEISVDVLGEAEEIDSEEDLDVKRYGVIVTNGGRRGLLLPDLEGVDTVQQQVEIAKQKAGIRTDEPVQLQRFEVIRHE